MKKKLKPIQGVGIHISFLLGMTLSSIQIKMLNFFENYLGKRFMLDDLKNAVILMGEPEKIRNKPKISEEVKNIKRTLCSLNDEIEDINKNVLEQLGIPKKIVLLNVDYVTHIIKEKLLYLHKSKETIKLTDENFKLKLSKEIERVLYSIKELNDFLSNREEFEGIKDIEEVLRKQIIESIHIYSIGYGKTAVLCAGRTIEKIINSYLKSLLDVRMISKEKYDELINGKKSQNGERFEVKYVYKMRFLKGNNFLTEEEFIDLQQFSFKRNKGGHPDLGDIDNHRARTLIQQSIWLIIDLQKKINKLNKAKILKGRYKNARLKPKIKNQ